MLKLSANVAIGLHLHWGVKLVSSSQSFSSSDRKCFLRIALRYEVPYRMVSACLFEDCLSEELLASEKDLSNFFPYHWKTL